jgi:exopolysaccharide biosynthesis polyprenyl glycosylphosphotransferase
MASTLRFDSSISTALLEYPGQPKVLIYPLIWYFLLHKFHAWDRYLLYFTNGFYTRVLSAGFSSLLTFSAIAYLIKFPISRFWVVINVVASVIVLLLIRIIMRSYLSYKYPRTSNLNYLYIGRIGTKDKYVSEFASIHGFVPNIVRIEPPKDGESDQWLQKYIEILETQAITGVIIGYSEIQDANLIRKLADTKREQVIDLILISRIASLLNRFDVQDLPNVVRIQESHLIGSGAVLKRIFDIIFSFLALIILSPVFLFIAILIKLTSKGPILYIDRRIGLNGKLFAFPKFRSMYEGSDKQRLEILGRPDETMSIRYKNDPRITPLGRFLRRWSLDEIPQFWSVLIGTMSIVGPRPILQEELPQVGSQHLLRFMAKPGLTGLWQVTGRKEVAWEDRMLRDSAYVDEWSFWKDCILILQTFVAIIRGTGAH